MRIRSDLPQHGTAKHSQGTASARQLSPQILSKSEGSYPVQLHSPLHCCASDLGLEVRVLTLSTRIVPRSKGCLTAAGGGGGGAYLLQRESLDVVPEGESPRQQLPHENPHAPHVRLLIILLRCRGLLSWIGIYTAVLVNHAHPSNPCPLFLIIRLWEESLLRQSLLIGCKCCSVVSTSEGASPETLPAPDPDGGGDIHTV